MLLALLLPISASAQILNVESLCKVTDTSGWSGNAGFIFSLKRNANDFILFGSSLHIQYKTPEQLILFKNDISFEKINGESFDKPNDYRISSDSSLLVELFKNFSLKTSCLFIYDAFPAESIPKSQYFLTTGLTYSFD